MPPAEQLYAENLELKEENAQLRLQIAWLKKRVFGGGKGERLDQAQLKLALEQLDHLVTRQSALQKISYERHAGEAAVRKTPEELFAKLPVSETVVVEPPEVKAAPDQFEKVGEERTIEVDIVPPKLVKREIIRPKYRHRTERLRPLLVATAPARAAAGGYASAGLIAWVLVAKYVDHQPLYRLERQSERWGARLSRQTMMEWVALGASWLEIIYRHMRMDLLKGGYIQADETPVRCQDPDEHPGKTVQGWLWVIGRPGSDVVFDWRMSRRHEEIDSLLAGFQGLLQSDGYEAYAGFVKARTGVTHLGCWAHARRYFHEALADAPARAGFVLRLIAQLYRLERTWDEAGLVQPVLRAQRRRSEFGLTLSLLHRTAARLRELTLPRSLLGQACTYLLGHWDVLVAHCAHGRTRLDNNAVENAIRPSAVGKKNWLFIGHPEAGQRSAIIYSIVVSCQRRGLDPLAYVRDLLTRLPAMTNHDDLDALTPARWKSAS